MLIPTDLLPCPPDFFDTMFLLMPLQKSHSVPSQIFSLPKDSLDIFTVSVTSNENYTVEISEETKDSFMTNRNFITII
jgi:hypothetical protein